MVADAGGGAAGKNVPSAEGEQGAEGPYWRLLGSQRSDKKSLLPTVDTLL